MLIGFNMPAVQSVSLVGGSWLTADAGRAMFDGKPARKTRINRTGALSINIVFESAIVPRIIALLGLNLPAGISVSAAGASGQTIRLPDGSVCAWLFPTGIAAVSSVAVQITTVVTAVEVGEIAVFRALEVGISDGWNVTRTDDTLHARTKGGQLNSVAGAVYRRLSATLSARPTVQVWGGGLAGMDWDAVIATLLQGRRGCVIPRYRASKSASLDPAIAAQSAIYGTAVNGWSADNVSGQYYVGFLEFEEVPG